MRSWQIFAEHLVQQMCPGVVGSCTYAVRLRVLIQESHSLLQTRIPRTRGLTYREQ